MAVRHVHGDTLSMEVMQQIHHLSHTIKYSRSGSVSDNRKPASTTTRILIPTFWINNCHASNSPDLGGNEALRMLISK